MKIHDIIKISLASVSLSLPSLASISQMNNIRLHKFGEERVWTWMFFSFSSSWLRPLSIMRSVSHSDQKEFATSGPSRPSKS